MNVPTKAAVSSPDLQEAKEAVCDALVSLVADRVAGVGEFGEVVRGRTPRSAFVSGLLLPRYDAAGADETSDIHVSVLGVDTQVRSGASGVLSVRPRFGVYVRVLPEWSDLEPMIDQLASSFSLTKEFKQKLSQRTAELRRSKLESAGVPDRIVDSDRAKKRALYEQRRLIKREAYQEARSELGLPPLTSERILEESALLPDATPGEKGAEDTGEQPGVVAADSIRALLQCPVGALMPIDIPMKWLRLQPDLPAFSVDLAASETELDAALKTYNAAVANALAAVFSEWATGTDGQAWAWRSADVVPSDLTGQEAWTEFSTRVRALPLKADEIAPPLTDVFLNISRLVDFSDPARTSLRVCLENGNRLLPRTQARRREMSIFQATLEVELPRGLQVSLPLDRVDPSYRFRHYMVYPAMGLNCGVTAKLSEEHALFRTTWMPRWIQPRLRAADIEVECRFAKLADDTFDPAALLKLPDEYRTWIEQASTGVRSAVGEGLSSVERDRELAAFATSLAAQRNESDLIEKGIRLLIDARKAWEVPSPEKQSDLASAPAVARPWAAWLLMNETFLSREDGDPNARWRLFQLAFVLAHVANIASRDDPWKHVHVPGIDEETASLLYFPTGGGKSEAFYGVLVFAMFFDRLRGKDRGVTGLVRYPLRLLTLQQAQRFLRLLVHGELVRHARVVGRWPFEIGFWVGRGNTPNQVSQFSSSIPEITSSEDEGDGQLAKQRQDGAKAARAYFQDLESYNKIPRCPLCSQPTGLRRITSGGDRARRVGIVCFSEVSKCAWNRYGGGRGRMPLPFLLSDDTIYQRAPAVVVGTIDKLAMLGQDMRTISRVFGMFGLARWILPNGHLLVPRKREELTDGPSAHGAVGVFPAYLGGQRVFHDPFPAVIVQDEGHLLEESLGTFAGLFETLLDAVFRRISAKHAEALGVVTWQQGTKRVPRLPRLIMATATVSHPERQMETLYQRRPLLFPSPGHDIWRSFFAEPAPAPAGNAERKELEGALGPVRSPESTAPWMRLYVSLMTNGSNHTVTTVSAISAFHVELTTLWRALIDPARQRWAIERMKSALRGLGSEWRSAALDRLVSAARLDVLLAILDLHRVSITYVTNKKGGDQIIDALDAFTRMDHARHGVPLEAFPTRLISGGVDMRDIQEVMRLAEQGPGEGEPWPPIDGPPLLRNVVATSAISHGVDVDRFNSMFFAGLPSDVAEYIQASSRVGRTHVGFVLLIPTPQSRRDRYVVETHDIYHRFLERMITAPASERWADNAIHRVAASFIQAWLSLAEADAFISRRDDDKPGVRFDLVPTIEQEAQRDKVVFKEAITAFALEAAGLAGRGDQSVGRPSDPIHYRDEIMRDAHWFVDDILRAGTSAELHEFWKERTVNRLQAPMTSLRDVDEAALIKGSRWSEIRKTSIDPEQLYYAMKIVRGQVFARSETEADVEPDSSESQAR